MELTLSTLPSLKDAVNNWLKQVTKLPCLRPVCPFCPSQTAFFFSSQVVELVMCFSWRLGVVRNQSKKVKRTADFYRFLFSVFVARQREWVVWQVFSKIVKLKNNDNSKSSLITRLEHSVNMSNVHMVERWSVSERSHTGWTITGQEKWSEIGTKLHDWAVGQAGGSC